MLALGLIGLSSAGCAPKEVSRFVVPNQTLGAMTIAVAPPLNFSGANDFDPNSVADLMASELSHLEGVQTIPVSRVLAVLARQGRQEVGSPTHALEITEALGADAILVFGVTEYDPYNPPIVGIAAQLYGHRRDGSFGSIDPILVSRQVRPFAVAQRVSANTPLAQAERVYDASHDYIAQEVRFYASHREESLGSHGWRKYLVSQRHYLRFCCHAIVKELASAGELSTVTVSNVR